MEINDANILNIYKFGSHLYKTNHEKSDEDFIIVVKKWYASADINVHVFTIDQFQRLLDNCDIQMLECYFSTQKIKEEHQFHFHLDKAKLRTSISTICSNSWVRGKKKLTVMGDYDKYLAIKSIFHSLRILDFGIQLAESGRIYDFSSMNYVLTDLQRLSEQYENIELWTAIDEKYRKKFNSLSSHFKSLCPKNTQEAVKRKELEEIFATFSIENEELFTQLLLWNK